MRLLLVLALAVAAVSAKVEYHGYKVFEVQAQNTAHELLLKNLHGHDGYDFWNRAKKAGYVNTIMVAPEKLQVFLNAMNAYQVPYKMIIGNVQDTLNIEEINQRLAPKVAQGKIDFTSYHSHDEINAYVRQLAADNPGIVTMQSIGNSYLGREMLTLSICTSGTCGTKPGILIEGGIHAREWISPAVVTYILNQLLESGNNDDVLNAVDWYILPVTNPDGYEYTRSSDRFWRKTRKPSSICTGVDPNRNFPYFWMHAGASNNECSDIFAGANALSEPECRQFTEWVETLQNIRLYTAVHSYGQWILYPYGYQDNPVVYPDNRAELQSVGDTVEAAIRGVSGTAYDVGNSAALLYAAAGASDDWAKSIGVDLSYTLELPGGGSGGFDLPPSRIQPVCTETWQGYRAWAQYVSDTWGKK